MEKNISIVQARALEQVDIDSAADDDYGDMQDDMEDVSYVRKINILCKTTHTIFDINLLLQTNNTFFSELKFT